MNLLERYLLSREMGCHGKSLLSTFPAFIARRRGASVERVLSVGFAGVMTMDDSKLRQDVLDELDWQPHIPSAQIAVRADQGVVRLFGYVSTYAEKVAAEQAVKRVAGVRAVVVERLEVKVPDGIPRCGRGTRSACAYFDRLGGSYPQRSSRGERRKPVGHAIWSTSMAFSASRRREHSPKPGGRRRGLKRDHTPGAAANHELKGAHRASAPAECRRGRPLQSASRLSMVW